MAKVSAGMLFCTTVTAKVWGGETYRSGAQDVAVVMGEVLEKFEGRDWEWEYDARGTSGMMIFVGDEYAPGSPA